MTFTSTRKLPTKAFKQAVKTALAEYFDDIALYLDDDEITVDEPPFAMVFALGEEVTETAPGSGLFSVPFGVDVAWPEGRPPEEHETIANNLWHFFTGILEDPAESDPTVRNPLAARLDSPEEVTEDEVLFVRDIHDVAEPAIQFQDTFFSISITAKAVCQLGRFSE